MMNAKKSLPLEGLTELGRIAGKVRGSRTRYEHLEQERDELIVKLLESGYSTRQLAEATGITQARVVQISRVMRKERAGHDGHDEHLLDNNSNH